MFVNLLDRLFSSGGELGGCPNLLSKRACELQKKGQITLGFLGPLSCWLGGEHLWLWRTDLVISNSWVINQENKWAFDIREKNKVAKKMLWGKKAQGLDCPTNGAFRDICKSQPTASERSICCTAKLIFNLLKKSQSLGLLEKLTKALNWCYSYLNHQHTLKVINAVFLAPSDLMCPNPTESNPFL